MYLETGEAQRDDVFSVEAGAEVVPGSRRMWDEQTGEIVVVAPESTVPDDDGSEFVPQRKNRFYAPADYSNYDYPDNGDERIPETATVREREVYDFILHAAPIELGPINRMSVIRVLSTLSGCEDLTKEDVLDRFKRIGMLGSRGSTEPLVLREVREDLPMSNGLDGRKRVFMDSIQPFRHPKAACSTPSNSDTVDGSYVNRFMPERGVSIDAPLRQCLGCAALGPCFEYAILKITSHTLGVWGGLNPTERRTLAKANGGTRATMILDSVAQRAQVIWDKHAKRLSMPPPENVVFAKLFVPEEIPSAPTKLQPS